MMLRAFTLTCMICAFPLAAQALSAPNALAKIAGVFDPPPAGKGMVVFFRTHAPGVGCMVREGRGAAEAHLSKLTNNRYFVHVAEPGPHRYWAKNLSKDGVNLEIEPGETYFVRCDIAIGMMSSNPNLAPSSAEAFDEAKVNLQPMGVE